MLLPKLPGPDNPEQYVNLNAFDKGGMGEVYLADDIVNGKKVAVKIIDVPKAEYEELFMRELEASRSLSGKNIVSTIYTGKALYGAQNFLFLVQEYYPNGNLRKRLTPKLDFDVCIRMMNDLLDGLTTVHTRIVHRDLKPENILISDDGSLLIADFGLAKYVEVTTKTNTFKGAGTYPYMAPECWTYQANSVGMDIYSLGIIFFEILTGQLPAKLATVDAWRDFHLFGQLPDLSALRPDVSVKLKQIIMKMTQKRVADRFPDAKSIKESLGQVAIQAKTEKLEIERLAQMAHSTIQQISAEQLRLKAQAEKDANNQKMMNYHISELFEKTKRIIAEINDKLETSKIIVKESSVTTDIKSRHLDITFNYKSLVFRFSAPSIFKEYEETRQRQHIDHQKRQYGMVMMPVGDSIFKQRKIVLIGALYCNYLNPALQTNYGFNLLLVKGDSDQYGTWYLASFSDSALVPGRQRKEFSLQEEEFLREFELCFSMHALIVDFRELGERDLTRALQEILQ